MVVPQKYRDVVSVLRRNGWQLLRTSGSHEVWRSPAGRRFVIPRHGDVSAGVVRQLVSLLEEKPKGWT
ncbi:MAG: type II toxin-antitoxin system HicA family toxin [Galactobacter sp.]|uniref:type II toxin-antitoxin system HicA family toxin n=1 Tax=Galactobacter sp. TaxID=2676125 RepID=UPI0025C6125E|nr:type II toxin-antitoxin system HicA family toxin [Galactobacter sp.]